MGIRSQNNPIAAYLDVFSRSGTDASTSGGGGGGGTALTASGGVISDLHLDLTFIEHIFLHHQVLLM